MKRKIRLNMRRLLTIILIVNLITIKLFSQDIKKIFADAEKQTSFMLQEIEKAKEAQVKKNPNTIFPCSLTPSGDMKLIAASDWRSGFFPGVLWYLYEYSGDKSWKEKAITLNAKIENEKWNAGTHDMGFKIYCSFGNGYRLTADNNYRDIIIQSAKTNIKRFNPKTGCICSWDHNKDKWYLDLAEKIAGFIFNNNNLPDDLVPYWDFNAPGIPNEPRDVSAAAIMASALYELSAYSKNGTEYKKKAAIILKNLTDKYRAPVGTSHGFILLHSTGNKPSNSEVDLPLNYADYYYLEALLRSKKR